MAEFIYSYHIHILIGKSPHAIILVLYLGYATRVLTSAAALWQELRAGDEEVRKEYWQELKETLAREDFQHPRFDFGNYETPLLE